MACQPSSVKFQLRRATASNWTSTNPILKAGEPGFETDTYKLKIGDGINTWRNLPYTSTTVGGPTGETGPQGIQGLKGETGPQGVTGTIMNPLVTYIHPTNTSTTSYTIDLTNVISGSRYYIRRDGSINTLIFVTPSSPVLSLNFHIFLKNTSNTDVNVYHFPGGVGSVTNAYKINQGTTTLEVSVLHKTSAGQSTPFLYVYWDGTNLLMV